LVEGWKEIGGRKRGEEVMLIVMVMRVNVSVNRMPLREVKWAGSRLQIIKRIHDK